MSEAGVLTGAVPRASRPSAAAAAHAASPATTRDPRLDVFRGLALVMIFINHVPENFYESFTSRSLGFSDAAEAFVLMAGIAAGLAYSGDFRKAEIWRGTGRLWGRAWTLYLVHVLVSIWAIALAALTAHLLTTPEILARNGLGAFFRDPLGVLIGLPTLLFHLGYADILPLYIVLLLATPLLIPAGLRWPRVVLGLSVLGWMLAGTFRLNFPKYPFEGGWFLNPLAWQLIFVIGLLAGIAMKEGRRLVPVTRWLTVLAVGYLVLSLAWTRSEAFAGIMRQGMLFLHTEAGLPWFVTGFNKSYLAAPRLLHVLALFYVVSAFAVFRDLAASRLAAPLALLGRQALPVFALGSVLAFLFQNIKVVTGTDLVLDTTLIALGLALQLALAGARQYWPAGRDKSRPPG